MYMHEVQRGKNVDENVNSNVRTLAVMGYLLFFVPLLATERTNFTIFHANQGFILLISWILINVIGSIIPVIGWFIILPLGNLALLTLMIIGMYHAARGETRPLPLINNIHIL